MTPDEYKKKCEWLSDFYKEAAETGREMQHFVIDAGAWATARSGPCEHSDPDRWRIKPEPQKAWVVWCPAMLAPIVSIDEEVAKKDAAKYGGTIQEITRPD